MEDYYENQKNEAASTLAAFNVAATVTLEDRAMTIALDNPSRRDVAFAMFAASAVDMAADPVYSEDREAVRITVYLD